MRPIVLHVAFANSVRAANPQCPIHPSIHLVRYHVLFPIALLFLSNCPFHSLTKFPGLFLQPPDLGPGWTNTNLVWSPTPIALLVTAQPFFRSWLGLYEHSLVSMKCASVVKFPRLRHSLRRNTRAFGLYHSLLPDRVIGLPKVSTNLSDYHIRYLSLTILQKARSSSICVDLP